MLLITDEHVEHYDIWFRGFDQASDGQDLHAAAGVGWLLDDYGVNRGCIGANPNKTFVGGSPIESQVSKISQTNALGGNTTVKLDHLTLVIQPYGTELELAETCDFNDLLQMYPMGTP